MTLTKRVTIGAVSAAGSIAIIWLLGGCARPEAQSVSGVKMATVGKLDTDDKGHTVEQRNVLERIQHDNEIGAVKHLYVISPYSGQVILYSTVKGKVTTGGKRLTPRTIENYVDGEGQAGLPTVTIGGRRYSTKEVANEDGTFGGGDAPYVYWTDTSGRYHQEYLSGGVVIHVSDQPLAVKSVVITTEPAK